MQSNTSTPKGAAHWANDVPHLRRPSGRGRWAVLAFALVACSACLALGAAGTASAQSPGTDQYTEPIPDGGGEPTNTNAAGSPDTGSDTGSDGDGAAPTTGSTTATTGDSTTSTGSDGGSDGGNGSAGDGTDEKNGEGGAAKGSPRDAGAVLSAAPKLATSDGSGDELWRSIWLPLLLVLSLIVAVGIRLRTSRSSSEDS